MLRTNFLQFFLWIGVKWPLVTILAMKVYFFELKYYYVLLCTKHFFAGISTFAGVLITPKISNDSTFSFSLLFSSLWSSISSAALCSSIWPSSLLSSSC
jgi:hypothetical protein